MLHLKKLFALLVSSLVLGACTFSGAPGNMTTLFDGRNLDNWDEVGGASWTFRNGYVEGSEATGYLVSERPYDDFRLIVEFWASEDANSGIFIRCQSNETITDRTCYEANIYDRRPDPIYRTGGIVHLASPAAQINAAGQWNRYEILALGSRLEIRLNGIQTVTLDDDQFNFDAGYIALQYGMGEVRFREVLIQEL